MVLYLGLSQRSLLNRRPHHRLRPLIERSVHQKLLEFFRDHALGVEIHRQVWVIPIARYTKPLELLTLDVDPTLGKLAAFLTELHHVYRVLIATLLAVLLLDLPLDWKAVTVPTGDIPRILTHHLLGSDNHVLKDFVQRVSDMQMPVGIGWSIVEREGLAAFFLAQAVIHTNLLPPLEPCRLAVRQTCAHWEVGLRQVQGVFIVGRIGTHVLVSFGNRNCQVGAAE